MCGYLSTGEDGCSIEGAIRLVKLAYSFEQWEVFDSLIENVLTYIRVSPNLKVNLLELFTKKIAITIPFNKTH